MAQTPNTTVADVNVLNLLSPFLSLNATPVGQQTLTANLADALALNQFAAANTTVAAISISDKTIFSGNSTTITLPSGATVGYGPGANLAGGLPVQQVQTPGTIAPYQQYGGLGTLGTAFQAAVAPTGAKVPALVTFLNNAYNFTSNDLGVAKNYFANGTANGTAKAVAPTGLTLPTANGYPNLTTSVLDTAYGVSNTGANQNIYGDSRPVQVTSSFTPYDPTALSGLATNPAFPSGHTNYAFTDSILIGMLSPNFYQSMLLRGSEYGQSRNELGVHYILDITASRAFAQYDLAQLLNASSSPYLQTNVATGATAQNLNTQFQAAATGLNAYLNTQTGSCGGSLAACAANNPYNTFSASTYGSQPYVTNPGTTTAATNAAIYAGRLTQGLPTLSYTAAPREGAPAGGPDASILLSTLYGGSTPQAQALAASVGGALYGNLSTGTINQVVVNTEGQALTAFYGTSLSYWTRINLYAAAGYFQGVTGSLAFAPGDTLNTPVTVANTGVVSGTATINGNLTFQSGSALATQGNGTTASTALTVNGTTALQAGSTVRITGLALPGQAYTLVTGTGAISVDPSVKVDTSQGTGLVPALTGTLLVSGDPALTVRVQSSFATAGTTANQRAVGAGLDAGGNGGTYGTAGTALLTSLIQNGTVASLPATLDSLSGEGIAAQQQAVFDATALFASTVLDAARGDLAGAQVVESGPRRMWTTGFGQTASLNGAHGSGNTDSSDAGFAVGGDYAFGNGLSVGLAGGYFTTDYSDVSRNTQGRTTGGQLAVYALQTFGNTYITGVVDGAFFHNTINRLTFGAANSASFGGNEILGRLEGGHSFAFAPVTVTPFVGTQIASLSNAAVTEFSTGNTGLSVSGHSQDSEKLYLGGQFDRTFTFGTASAITPYARLAWEHEFSTQRTINASFTALPGSGFSVSAAPAAEDAARVDVGAKVNITPAFSVYAAFDGAFSGQGNSYGGKGGLRIVW